MTDIRVRIMNRHMKLFQSGLNETEHQLNTKSLISIFLVRHRASAPGQLTM